MQRHACAPDFFYQRLAARVNFVQVRRTKWLLSRARENNVTHLQIANRPIIGCCKRIEFFCDTQRRLTNFIIRTNVSDDRRINCVAKHHERVITYFNRIGATGKRARHHDERIGCADQKTELFQRAKLRAQFRDCIAQVAFARRRSTCLRELVLSAF